jgi:hypothetical protein
VEIRGHQNSREEDLHGFPCTFSFRAWIIKHLIESDGASQLCLCCTSLFDLLGSTTRAEAQKGNEPFHIPKLRATPSIGVGTSKLKRSLARLEVTFSWITEQDGYMKSHEIKTTWLAVNQRKAGYWIDLVNAKKHY